MGSARSGHEETDVGVRGIVVFAVALVAAVLLTMLVARVTIVAFQGVSAPALPLARPQLPPEPRLQTTPPADLEALRQQEDLELRRCVWIDRSNGIVQIPIEEAKTLLLSRGLPVRPTPAGGAR